MDEKESKALVDSLNEGSCWVRLSCKDAADRIKALEAENALLEEFTKALLQDDPNLVAAMICDHPKLQELAESAALEEEKNDE